MTVETAGAVPSLTEYALRELEELEALLRERQELEKGADTVVMLRENVAKAGPDADPSQVAEVAALAEVTKIAAEIEADGGLLFCHGLLAAAALRMVAASPATALRHAEDGKGS